MYLNRVIFPLHSSDWAQTGQDTSVHLGRSRDDSGILFGIILASCATDQLTKEWIGPGLQCFYCSLYNRWLKLCFELSPDCHGGALVARFGWWGRPSSCRYIGLGSSIEVLENCQAPQERKPSSGPKPRTLWIGATPDSDQHILSRGRRVGNLGETLPIF